MSPPGTPRGLGHADSLKAGFFKERVDVPHLRKSFNPRPRAGETALTNERRRQPRPAIHRMQYHPRKRHDLVVQTFQSHPRPPPGLAEEAVALAKRNRGRSHHANPDRLLAMPKQGDESHEAEVMASVMPPRKVRPIRYRSGGEVDVLKEADPPFFFRAGSVSFSASDRRQSICPSKRQTI